jgi:hypothetical protein
MATDVMTPISSDGLAGTMVAFLVGEGEGRFVERLHAIPLGGGVYVLDNSPFYAYDISYKDVFRAVSEDGSLVFSEVVSRGGHSTYRIKLPVGCDHEYFSRHWSELDRLGCTFEGSSGNAQRLYAIDVPPDVNVFEVYRLLEERERDNVWTFEEGHCAPQKL